MGKKKKSQEQAPPINPLAPIVMVGATWLATQLAEVAYKSITGKQPPKPNDPEEKLIRVALWTAALTGIVTLAEVAVTKYFDESD